MTDESKIKLVDKDKPSLEPPERVDAKAYFEAVASLRKPLQPLRRFSATNLDKKGSTTAFPLPRNRTIARWRW